MDTVVRCTLLLPLTALQAAVLVQEGRSRSRGRSRGEQVQRSRSMGVQDCRKLSDQTKRLDLELEVVSTKIPNPAGIFETPKEGYENTQTKNHNNKSSVDWLPVSLKLVSIGVVLSENFGLFVFYISVSLSIFTVYMY